MEKKNQAWIRLPLAVLQDEKLSLYEAVIFSLLIDKDTGTGQIRAGVKELAEKAGISERKARSAIHLLKDTGYIKEIQYENGGISTYTLAEVLQPKKRGTGQAQYQYSKKKKKKADENAFCDMDHFEEDYEVFINNF